MALAVQLPDPEVDVFTGEKLPTWLQEDNRKQPRSTSHSQCTLRIAGSDEEWVLPTYTSTKVCEIKRLIGAKLGREPGTIMLVTKQGCSWINQKDTDEVARRVTVRGITSFKREKVKWPYPMAIIGAGHLGLRQAMWFLKHQETNFVVYDRHSTVGGMAWHDQANKTSKLQTELGTYHLQFDEDNPVPKNMSTWPSRDELLKHFQEVSDEYGITPYIKFQTDVKLVNVDKGDKRGGSMVKIPGGAQPNFPDQTYRFILNDLQKPKNETEVIHSNMCMFPGNLTVPRREDYKGEEDFNGPIIYAIQDGFDYTNVTGRNVVIVGHGAFAVENIRTCAEYDVGKIYLVCRRRNLACPRVASWMVNQSYFALPGKMYMDVTAPMYDLIGVDPWSYHSVFGNEKRTTCTITQKARFGIGDVYFLTIAMGVCEIVDDKVKRLTQHCCHLESGNSLDCRVILKLLGFVGHWDNDKIVGLKEMKGYWVNGDFRRFLIAEPIGVNASNFGGTSFSPGARSWVEMHAHFCWYPMDFQMVLESNMLQSHPPEPENDRPGYVIDSRYATTCGMTVSGLVSGLQESSAKNPFLKREKQLACHPTEKYLEECSTEWDAYAQRFKANGAPKPPPPYPYTLSIVNAFLNEEKKLFDAAMAGRS